MDRLTRLVIRAKKAVAARSEWFHFGSVHRYHEGGPYIAQAFVWSGKPGTGREILSEHETEQEALDALTAISEEYPNTQEDTLIFYGGYDLLD